MRSADAPLAKEIITKLLRLAKLQSMQEIYGRVTPGPDGRIRTNLSPVATITGRLGSSETFLEVSTNLQNIPKKTAMLDPLFDVRSVMTPDARKILIESDLSQAEARATSAFARDEATLEIFASGQDIHKITAAKIFGCTVEEVSKQRRHLGKMARHALNYGMGWRRFQEAINSDADLTGISISAREAKGIVEAYHRENPALTRWWGEVEEAIHRRGYLMNPFGRKLTLIDQADLNSAIAFLPQSTVADHVNMRLRVIYDTLDPDPLEVLLQIHDAVLAQAPMISWRRAATALRAAMEAPIQIGGISLLIPADVSASSSSWGEMRGVAA